jgi:abortive infection bacteriophage resistance protein
MGFDVKCAKSKQQIATEYGICTKTLSKWLKEENITIKRGLINPKQQLHLLKMHYMPEYSI